MKWNEDNHRRDFEFEVGEWVLLKITTVPVEFSGTEGLSQTGQALLRTL